MDHTLSVSAPTNYRPEYNAQNYEDNQYNNNDQNYQENTSNEDLYNFEQIINTIGTTRATQAPTRAPTYATTQRHFPVNRNSGNYNQNIQCGVPKQGLSDSVGLVINGQAAVKGQFPWLAAYYHNGVDNNGFICGGTLISSQSVITAAHCIHEKNGSPKHEYEAQFYIGKFYITSRNDEKNFIISSVSRFIVHPDWSSQSLSYDGDIAIVKLTRIIQFSDFIKPICLWTSTSNYHDAISQFGIVAGYGKTEKSSTTSDKPYWTALPVIDEGTCLRSNENFIKITSRRTFCVGSRDGRGPCNGKI